MREISTGSHDITILKAKQYRTTERGIPELDERRQSLWREAPGQIVILRPTEPTIVKFMT